MGGIIFKKSHISVEEEDSEALANINKFLESAFLNIVPRGKLLSTFFCNIQLARALMKFLMENMDSTYSDILSNLIDSVTTRGGKSGSMTSLLEMDGITTGESLDHESIFLLIRGRRFEGGPDDEKLDALSRKIFDYFSGTVALFLKSKTYLEYRKSEVSVVIKLI